MEVVALPSSLFSLRVLIKKLSLTCRPTFARPFCCEASNLFLVSLLISEQAVIGSIMAIGMTTKPMNRNSLYLFHSHRSERFILITQSAGTNLTCFEVLPHGGTKWAFLYSSYNTYYPQTNTAIEAKLHPSIPSVQISTEHSMHGFKGKDYERPIRNKMERKNMVEV